MGESERNGVSRMNKAQRLAVAAAVAPSLRQGAEAATARVVGRLGPDGKTVVGYTTLAEVQKAVLLRHQIEVDVQPGVKPEHITCPGCGTPIRVPKHGLPPKQCARCKAGGQTRCAGYEGHSCNMPPSPEAFKPRTVRARHGEPWRCRSCHNKSLAEAIAPIACAGYDGHVCDQVSGLRATRKQRSRKDGHVWRCRTCAGRLRTIKKKAERDARQKTCAGYDGHTCQEPVPLHAFHAQFIKSRDGGPWRCKQCSVRDPEYRRLRSEVAAASFNDPERRLRNAEHMRRWRDDPKWKAQQAEKCRRMHADPEVQKRRIEAVRRSKTRGGDAQ